MTPAIRLHRFGGPEVLELDEVAIGDPGPGQVRVRHEAIGLNMVDTYYRTGLYPLELPAILGSEAAGVVVAVGADVAELAVGDRIAYASPPPLGAYAGERLIDARWVARLPASVTAEVGAAVTLKGLTSWFLLHRSYPVQPGDWVVIYAAAGGVGQIATQWARLLGAHVIGVVGSESKRLRALGHGCTEVLLMTDDISEQVRRITGGSGAAAVYDSIGRETFLASLDSLRPHGVMVTFGNASGAVEPFAPLELARRGSLYVTRPTLFDFTRERATLEAATAALYGLVGTGQLAIDIAQRYALADAAQAHRDLEARRTIGSSVLIP
jgi:NADPH2:quinone reductase